MIKLNNQGPEYNDQDFIIKKYLSKRLNTKQSNKIFWVCFVPRRTSLQIIRMFNLVPRKSDILVYRVPDAFLASSPKITEKAFMKLKKDFEKEYDKLNLVDSKISFLAISVGAMPAFYFANKLKCEKLVSVCPTDKLGDGIFNALAAEKIRKKVIENGHSAYTYDEYIKKINPASNLKNLPNNVEIYLAKFDKFIPFYGGERLVRNIKKYKKKVVVKKFNFLGHFMAIIMFGLLNKD